MSKHEWKPGDVAMHRDFGLAFVVDFHLAGCPASHATHHRHTHYSDGDWGLVTDALRPLVVIDPEDREQVERLLVNFRWPKPVPSYVVKEMQAALREFASPTPPKPDEPTGLGAVVEDAEGQRYTQVGVGCWVARGLGLEGYGWGEIAVVRVLSEGVS